MAEEGPPGAFQSGVHRTPLHGREHLMTLQQLAIVIAQRLTRCALHLLRGHDSNHQEADVFPSASSSKTAEPSSTSPTNLSIDS